MAETKTDEQTEADESQAKDRFGRVLDVAGIAAGVIIGVIIFDVLSGGKISRLLARQKPCEDCQDKADQPESETSRDG